MTNNPFTDGDVFYALDAGMLNARYVNPFHQQLSKTLQGSNLTTSTNLTVVNSQVNAHALTLNAPGGLSDGSLLQYTGNKLFSGIVFSTPSVTTATAISESFASDATVSKGSGIFDYQFLDNYDAWNSGVDLTKWTVTAGVTEDTAQLILTAGLGQTRTALTNGTGGQNLQSYKYFCTLLNWTSSGSANTGESVAVQVYLNDGAADTSVYSQTTHLVGGGGDATFSGAYSFLEFFHDASAKIVLVYLNSNYLTRYTYATSTLRVKYEIVNSGSIVTLSGILNVKFLGLGDASSTSTVVHTISANGGTNFETYTEADSHSFTNTGNYLRLKGIYTLVAAEMLVMKGWALQIDK